MTGRQIYAMISDGHSLWAVQQALKELMSIGLVDTQTYGRSIVHSLRQRQVFVPALRAMSSPVEMLDRVVNTADLGADAIILFGSIARGEATQGSDVDLAVIAPKGWDGALVLQESVWEKNWQRLRRVSLHPR